jgi:hypothetical protein
MASSDVGTLTPAERKELADALARSAALLLAAGNQLSAEQWGWKSHPDRWSIAECFEHVAIVEKLVLYQVRKMAPDATVSSDELQRVSARDAEILRTGRSRATKWEAPRLARPTGQFQSLAEFEGPFRALRDLSLELIATTQAPLHAIIKAHPALGEMNGYQWLLFIALHCERHAEQAQEVRRDPGFPPSSYC